MSAAVVSAHRVTALPAAGRLDGPLAAVRWVGLALTASTAFFPYLVGLAGNGVFVAAAGLWMYAVAELLGRGRSGAALAFWMCVPVVGFALTYLTATGTALETAALGALPGVFRDFVLIVPAGIGAGLVAAGDPGIRRLLTSVRLFAGASALGALAEAALGRQLLPGNTLEKIRAGGNTSVDALLLEGGGVRAIVAADHPLVLAALLAAAVPLALASSRGWWGRAEALLLIGGIWATNSDGPLVLSIFALVASVFLARRRVSWLLGWASRLLPVFSLLFLAVSAFVFRPVIVPDAILDASSQYRFAIYSLVPQILGEMPWGYGPGAIPRGVLLIEEQRGVIDVSRTVDSELVLSVIEYGILGFLVFSALLWLALRAPRDAGPARPAALALLMLTTSGLFLALHVWVSVLPMWMFLVGVGIHLTVRSGATTTDIPGGNR